MVKTLNYHKRLKSQIVISLFQFVRKITLKTIRPLGCGIIEFPLKSNLSLFYFKFDMLFFSLIYFISEFCMPSHL